jgi:uncharacterized protein YjbJ (UPF0337 family)
MEGAMDAGAQSAPQRLRIFVHRGVAQSGQTHPEVIQRNHQENSMNKDQVAGRAKELEGKVKEVAGKVVGNKTLEVKGKIENAKGHVQAGYGDLKSDINKSR